MESGNTAIQVGPVPTEEEMGKVREYFSRALDAIVSHADITRQVQALSGQVSQLNTRLASAEHYANNLNTSLEETRQARDEALTKVRDLTAQSDHLYRQVQGLTDDRRRQDERLTNTMDMLSERTKERDEAQFHNLELTEALEAERAKVKALGDELKAFHDKVSSLLGNVAQAMQPTNIPEGVTSYPSPAPEVASPHPIHGTGFEPATTSSEGQREPSPTNEPSHPWMTEDASPTPASSPEASSAQGASVGIGAAEGGGSQPHPEGFDPLGHDADYHSSSLPDFLTKPVEPQRDPGDESGYRHSDDDKYGR